MGKSFSRNSKYSLAPPATPSSAEAEEATSAVVVVDAKTGSAASNLESSAVRSEGKVGAWGAAGAAYDLTLERWASAFYHGRGEVVSVLGSDHRAATHRCCRKRASEVYSAYRQLVAHVTRSPDAVPARDFPIPVEHATRRKRVKTNRNLPWEQACTIATGSSRDPGSSLRGGHGLTSAATVCRARARVPHPFEQPERLRMT
mgnify:CR=1 FL=1